MSLYPSLEDMKAGEIIQAQFNAVHNAAAGAVGAPSAPGGHGFYPTLGNGASNGSNSAIVASAHYPRLHDFMGLELTEEMIRLNMPEYLEQHQLAPVHGGQQQQLATQGITALATPVSGTAIQKQLITHSIRRVQLTKPTANTKLGIRVRSMNTGVFICLVINDSIAARSGLRFGDQILQVDDQDLVGKSAKEVHNLLKGKTGLVDLVVRDRPFERKITLIPDSHHHIGFQFKNGKIINIVKDSSAARNGLLTNHQLLEINGRNVIGMKDKEVTKIIQELNGPAIITIIPTFIYEHIVKEMDKSLFGKMDHAEEDI